MRADLCGHALRGALSDPDPRVSGRSNPITGLQDVAQAGPRLEAMTPTGGKRRTVESVEPTAVDSGEKPRAAGGIPDFAKDAATIAEYDAAKARFERSEISHAESAVRASYTRKRAGVLAEIAAAANALEERKKIAERNLKGYAEAYPRHVRGNQIERPGFFEWLFSFGGASRLYNSAARSSQDVVNAQATYRRRQRWEEELENWLRRSIHRVTVELKERAGSQEWLDKFSVRAQKSPICFGVCNRSAKIGKPTDSVWPPATSRRSNSAIASSVRTRLRRCVRTFDGMMIDDIMNFGDISIWIFLDLQTNKYWLPYDRRLENLIDSVFDTYRLVDDLKAKFNRSEDGRRFTPLDHYLRRLRDETDSRVEWRKRTTNLRTQKDVARDSPIKRPRTRKSSDLLASLAATSPARRRRRLA